MLWPRSVRDLWSWEPWEQMRRLQREMSRYFPDWWPGARRPFPPVNVWTGRDDVVVTAELPGVDPAKIDLAVEGDTLTLSGSRELSSLKEGQSFSRQERPGGAFSRVVQLPFRADPAKVDAEYKKGVLRVTLPRLEEDKPKQITVKTAE
ncbi:MAG: Hsp20/alpha crystallin family protein [bacterium]